MHYLFGSFIHLFIFKVCFHCGANWAPSTWISFADTYTATQNCVRAAVLEQPAHLLPAKRHNQSLTYTCSLTSCLGLKDQNHIKKVLHIDKSRICTQTGTTSAEEPTLILQREHVVHKYLSLKLLSHAVGFVG